MRLSVGVDISKGKSTVALIRDDQKKVEIFEVRHDQAGLAEFARFLALRDEQVRVVCEETGNYAAPLVKALQDEKIFVSCVNPVVIKKFSVAELHGVKTDKADAKKIALYGLYNWSRLKETMTENQQRDELKLLNHQRQFSADHKKSVINSLISLTDRVFLQINEQFSNCPYKPYEKWVDFLDVFWHPEMITSLTPEDFSEKYRNFCSKKGYKFSQAKADQLYSYAQSVWPTLQKDSTVRKIVKKAVKRVRTALEEADGYDKLLIAEAKKMPEFEIVASFPGVGELLAAQLIAEIGDVRRFKNKKALIAYAGIDPGANQSGQFDKKSNQTSKRGDSYLRRSLYNVMKALLMNPPKEDTAVYDFLDKKRKENKPYRVYMVAGAAKFLRVYYGRVNEYLASQEEDSRGRSSG